MKDRVPADVDTIVNGDVWIETRAFADLNMGADRTCGCDPDTSEVIDSISPARAAATRCSSGQHTPVIPTGSAAAAR